MPLYTLIDDDGSRDFVRVDDTQIGKGVFSVRPYPASSVIGEISGHVIADADYGSEYSIELEDDLQLEPYEPFRYVNHSCDPNCEFDWIDYPDATNIQHRRRVYLIAIRDIESNEQLTIDYNWPASYAMRCRCGSPKCRGWIVGEDELAFVAERSGNVLSDSRRRGPTDCAE